MCVLAYFHNLAPSSFLLCVLSQNDSSHENSVPSLHIITGNQSNVRQNSGKLIWQVPSPQQLLYIIANFANYCYIQKMRPFNEASLNWVYSARCDLCKNGDGCASASTTYRTTTPDHQSKCLWGDCTSSHEVGERESIKSLIQNHSSSPKMNRKEMAWCWASALLLNWIRLDRGEPRRQSELIS